VNVAAGADVEPYGSMNARTTRVSIELRHLKMRKGRLLTGAGCVPSRETMAHLHHAARFLGLPTAWHGILGGWLPDMQSTAIAFIEGPS